jgi:hypothetical protein
MPARSSNEALRHRSGTFVIEVERGLVNRKPSGRAKRAFGKRRKAIVPLGLYDTADGTPRIFLKASVCVGLGQLAADGRLWPGRGQAGKALGSRFGDTPNQSPTGKSKRPVRCVAFLALCLGNAGWGRLCTRLHWPLPPGAKSNAGRGSTR